MMSLMFSLSQMCYSSYIYVLFELRIGSKPPTQTGMGSFCQSFNAQDFTTIMFKFVAFREADDVRMVFMLQVAISPTKGESLPRLQGTYFGV